VRKNNMAFDKDEYWANKENKTNVGSFRNAVKRYEQKIARSKQSFETLVRSIPKMPSKYAMRKNTRRNKKHNDFYKKED